MTDDPIILDGRRSAVGRRGSEMRRRPANDQPLAQPSPQPQLGSLDDWMLAEPARTWLDVMEKWRFLLDRYAATQEAEDECVRTLIERALGDMDRLLKREERK